MARGPPSAQRALGGKRLCPPFTWVTGQHDTAQAWNPGILQHLIDYIVFLFCFCTC